MKSVKLLLHVLVCLLLCAVCTLGAADDSVVNCYWQLEEVLVETLTAEGGCESSVLASAQPLSGLSVEEMIAAMRGENTLSLSATRKSNGRSAKADYTYSTVPALVPGSAAARLSVTAATQSEENSYYLYSTIGATNSASTRMRGNGAWVLRTSFPRQAGPGTQRALTVSLKEYNGFASVTVRYVYEACPGAMIIDTNNDIVLYDLEGNEIARYGQTVGDLLPIMMGASAGSAEGDTIFSAEAQEDGSLIVRMDPDSGLSHSEIIRLIRAAEASAKTDAAVTYDVVPSLSADESAATLYIAAGTELSDETLSALIAAAQGSPIDVTAMQSAVSAGDAAVTAEKTPTPAPISYKELQALIASGETEKPAAEEIINSEYVTGSGSAAQAVVLYGEDGVQAIVLVPGAEATGEQVLSVIEKLENAGALSKTYEATYGHDASALGLTGENTASSTMIVEASTETAPESTVASG